MAIAADVPAKNGHVRVPASRTYHPGPNGEAPGWVCPKCGSANVGTKEARHNYVGAIWRSLICWQCEHVWASIEISLTDVPPVRGPWVLGLIRTLQQAVHLWMARPRVSRGGGLPPVSEVVLARRMERTRRESNFERWRDVDWARGVLSRCDGSEPFHALLTLYRLRADVATHVLAKAAAVDGSYIRRLEYGERDGAKRAIVLALAGALGLSELERDQFLVAAGHAPETLRTMGWTPELHEAAALAQAARMEVPLTAPMVRPCAQELRGLLTEHGSRAALARRLGISRRTLGRWLVAEGVEA